MTARRTTAIGSVLVLAVPVGYFLMGQLVTAGLAPYDRVRPLLDAFGALGSLDLFIIGPVGIAMVVWSRGMRGFVAVFGVLLSLLVFVVAWFIGVATLTGALGNPF